MKIVFRKAMNRRFNSESGQGMVEYSLIMALIVLAVFVVMASGMSVKVHDMYQNIRATISAVP